MDDKGLYQTQCSIPSAQSRFVLQRELCYTLMKNGSDRSKENIKGKIKRKTGSESSDPHRCAKPRIPNTELRKPLLFIPEDYTVIEPGK